MGEEGQEEKKKRREPDEEILGTSLTDGLCGESTIDLGAGSTIDLGAGAASSVDLEETSRGKGSNPVPYSAGTVRGDGSNLNANRDSTTGTSCERNDSDEVPCDAMQDCGQGLHAGTAATTEGPPDNNSKQGVYDESNGGSEGGGGQGGDDEIACSDTTGAAAVAAGAATAGSTQSFVPNLKQVVVARTHSGDRRHFGDSDVRDNGSNSGGGGQRGHRQRACQDKGSSVGPSATKVVSPLGGGSLRENQDLLDPAFGNSRKVGGLVKNVLCRA